MRFFILLLFAVALHTASAEASIRQFAEMSSSEIASLDQARTVVLIVGGPIEEHGPYLPTYTDGYLNAHAASMVANAIVGQRPNWTVVLMPSLPLGVGGANELTGRMTFPGSVGVREATLSAVLMDWATQLGDQGFRRVFVLMGHGSPLHNRAIDLASDYFTDEYGGMMLNLTGLLPPDSLKAELDAAWPPSLTPAQQQENGFDPHAGYSETSRLLFVRPELVSKEFQHARAWAGPDLTSLVKVGQSAEWPGYFGSPRLANKAAGRAAMHRQGTAELALLLLDGLDPRALKRESVEILADPADAATAQLSEKRDVEILTRQQNWLRNLTSPSSGP